MAIPKDWKSISTNLPLPRLKTFLDALEEKRVRHVPGSTSEFAGSAGCEFYFEGARYSLDEFFETVTAVDVVSAKPAFVKAVIGELEKELSIAVRRRDYKKAEAINDKIKSIKGASRSRT